MNKKAQPSGGNAAILLIVIAAFILLYVLFLPGKERDELLGGGSVVSADVDSEVVGSVLLKEHPGALTKLKEQDFEHSIPSFNIVAEKEDVVLKKVDSLFVDNSEPVHSIPLSFKDEAENVLLSFSVEGHKGTLSIKVDGERVFRGEVERNVDPISLEGLSGGSTIEFSVDKSPSWMFWSKNFYDIRNVQVSGTVSRLSGSEALNTFFVSADEANADNIAQAYLIYLIDCRGSGGGKVDVFLNGKLLSSKVPDCGGLEKTLIAPSDLVAGRNELKFSTLSGRYLVDRVFVKVFLKELVLPVFFFDVNRTQFRKISDGVLNSSLSVKFADDGERKRAVIDVNEHRIFLDTRQKSFSRNIDAFVIEGSNSLSIDPETTFNVLELKVSVDCRKENDCR